MTLFESVKSSSEFHDIPAYEWVPPGQQPADLLSAFETKKGDLSLYKIEDKDNRKLCLSIIASILGPDARSGSDYLIIDLDSLKDINIATLKPSKGTSRIKWVNNLHYDLIHFTIDNIVMLVNHLPEILVRADGFEKDEILEKYQELAHQQSSE